MVLIALSNLATSQKLKKELELHKAIVKITSSDDIERLFCSVITEKFSVIVTEAKHISLSEESWHKILLSLAKDASVLIYNSDLKDTSHIHIDNKTNDKLAKQSKPYQSNHSSIIDLKKDLTVKEIADYIQQHFGLGPGWYFNIDTPRVNLSLLKKTLSESKVLHLFLINGNEHSNIYTEYGVKIHSLLIDIFYNALYKSWSELNIDSDSDLIFKQDTDSNVYFIFTKLEKFAGVPKNGFLKEKSYELFCLMQKHMKQMLKDKISSNQLEGLIEKICKFTVGYSSLMHNRCFSIKDSIRVAIKNAKVNSQWMKHRIVQVETDLVVALMAKPEMLYTRYQAVFDVQKVQMPDIERYKNQEYTQNDHDKIYGFESLLGINKQKVEEYLSDINCHIEPDDLNPLSFFDLAKKSDLSLELDQACISLTSQAGDYLPHKLLVNIFPRNLYYIEKLIDIIPKNIEIVFEIAESRIIKNSDFLLEARIRLQDIDIGIATDDVSKGFANFKRLLSLKPDLIKLDRDLITDADKHPRKASIINLFTRYSKQFGHKILAEGIETIEEYKLCKKLQVDYVQGFLLHKPTDIENIKDQFCFEFKGHEQKNQIGKQRIIKQSTFSNEDHIFNKSA